MMKLFEKAEQPAVSKPIFQIEAIALESELPALVNSSEYESGISVVTNPAQPKFGQNVHIMWFSNGWQDPEGVRCEAYFNDILLGSGGRSGFAETLELYIPITVDIECSSAKDRGVTIHVPISPDTAGPAPNTHSAQLVPIPNVSPDSPVFKGGLILNATHIHIADTSPEVVKLQTFLAQDPVIYPEGKVTGYVDEPTVKAIARFQKICKIDPPNNWIGDWYGCVGPRTIPALRTGCVVPEDAVR